MKLLGWIVKIVLAVGSIVAALAIWDAVKSEENPYEYMQ